MALIVGVFAVVSLAVTVSPQPVRAAGSVSPVGSAPGTAPAGAAGSSSLNRARETWGISPVRSGKADDRTFMSYQIGAGGQYSDKVVLLNYGIASVRLNVFAADLSNDVDGNVVAGLDTDTPKDAASWVRLGGRELTATVPPRTRTGPGQVLVPFTIAVPSGATPGDHSAAIMAQLSSLGKNPDSQNVRLNQRIGTRIYLRVNGKLDPRLTVDNLTVSYRQSLNPVGGGAAVVDYTVHNTGNVRLSAQQAVSVTGMFGTSSKVVTPAGVQLLFPGGSQQVRVRVSGVFPAIFEKSHVTVTPKLFDDQQSMTVPSAAATDSFTAVPWMLLLCLLVLVLLIVAAWLLRRRAKGQPKARHGRNGPTQPTKPQRTPQTIGS